MTTLREYDPSRIRYATALDQPGCWSVIDGDVYGQQDVIAAADEAPPDWADLVGSVNDDGDWVWDGAGSPSRDGLPVARLEASWVERCEIVRDDYLIAAKVHGCVSDPFPRSKAPSEPYVLISLHDPRYGSRDPGLAASYRGAETEAWIDVSINDRGNTETIETYSLNHVSRSLTADVERRASDVADGRGLPCYTLTSNGRYYCINKRTHVARLRAELTRIASESDDVGDLQLAIDNLTS